MCVCICGRGRDWKTRSKRRKGRECGKGELVEEPSGELIGHKSGWLVVGTICVGCEGKEALRCR